MLIFEHAHPGRRAHAQAPYNAPAADDLPAEALRRTPPPLPETSELDVVRHYTRLSPRRISASTPSSTRWVRAP
jgi:glycine dehydrogenase subunit 2